MVVAYLRVSTGKQHLENQRHEIESYVKRMGIRVDRWHKDIVSGSVNRNDRKLGKLMAGMNNGDVLIVTEVSRLSRTLMEIMNIINICIEKKVALHCVKEGYIFEDNMNSKILGFAFGLVAEIERNLISARTKEALAAKRAEGVILGRPAGSSPKMAHLIRYSNQIGEMVEQGVPYRDIAYQYDVSICTLYKFVSRHIKNNNPDQGPSVSESI